MTWGRAVRSLVAAAVLVLAVVVVAGNFVLVQVRILGLGIETRLAWAVVVPAAIAFWAGTVWSRTGRPVPSTTMPGTPTAGICEDDHELRQVIRRALELEGFRGPTRPRPGPRRCVATAPIRPTSSCWTSACRTPTGATSARPCAPRASPARAVPHREATI